MYKNTCMHKKISHSCLGWFTEKYILRQFLSIYYFSLNLSTWPSFKRTRFSCTRLCLWVHWYDRWVFFLHCHQNRFQLLWNQNTESEVDVPSYWPDHCSPVDGDVLRMWMGGRGRQTYIWLPWRRRLY